MGKTVMSLVVVLVLLTLSITPSLASGEGGVLSPFAPLVNANNEYTESHYCGESNCRVLTMEVIQQAKAGLMPTPYILGVPGATLMVRVTTFSEYRLDVYVPESGVTNIPELGISWIGSAGESSQEKFLEWSKIGIVDNKIPVPAEPNSSRSSHTGWLSDRLRLSQIPDGQVHQSWGKVGTMAWIPSWTVDRVGTNLVIHITGMTVLDLPDEGGKIVTDHPEVISATQAIWATNERVVLKEVLYQDFDIPDTSGWLAMFRKFGGIKLLRDNGTMVNVGGDFMIEDTWSHIIYSNIAPRHLIDSELIVTRSDSSGVTFTPLSMKYSSNFIPD